MAPVLLLVEQEIGARNKPSAPAGFSIVAAGPAVSQPARVKKKQWQAEQYSQIPVMALG
jgi:hypothetical protein